MKIDNFFAELKRRNVYKVAAAYAVVAWLLIQIATQVFPFFEIPNWAVRLVVILLILGFPVALVLSWAFEITPEGIKRESEIAPSESITYHTGRKIVGITIAVAVLAAGLFVFQLLRPRLTSTGVSSSAVNALPENSVAVLAFANLSDDKGSEYFSDGISEELLTVLQKIPGLHVAARTSAFSFKGTNATAQEIGRKLGVAHLVEGSVRKAGDVVRIAARLTQANTGEEQWSENYTRNLKDVFAVQTELAQTIVEQLRGQLAGDAPNPTTKADIQAEVRAAAKGGTENVEAHEAFCKAAFFLIATQKRKLIKPGLLLNARYSWIPSSHSHGQGWLRPMFGIATMRRKGARKGSMPIWPLRARRWKRRSPSSQIYQRRCLRGR